MRKQLYCKILIWCFVFRASSALFQRFVLVRAFRMNISLKNVHYTIYFQNKKEVNKNKRDI